MRKRITIIPRKGGTVTHKSEKKSKKETPKPEKSAKPQDKE